MRYGYNLPTGGAATDLLYICTQLRLPLIRAVFINKMYESDNN